MATDLTALGDFLTAFQKLETVDAPRDPSALDRFFREARSLSDRIGEQRQLSGERFNIFEALGLHDDELQHSLFLAYLLNPRQTHDQGTLFLRTFLDHVGLVHMQPVEGDPGVSVQTEYVTEDGRFDVILFLGAVGIVCMENKVWAPEQPHQLHRYRGWLSRNLRSAARGCILFLTPNGRSSNTLVALPAAAANEVPVHCISYLDIAQWLDRVVDKVPTHIAVTLQMYGQLCRQLAQAAPAVREQLIREKPDDSP